RQLRHADRGFLGGNDHRQGAANAAGHETTQFGVGIVMVINEAKPEIYVRSELFDRAFKTFRRGEPAERSDERAAQSLESQSLAGVNILQIKRTVGALDDLGGAIVTADALDQFIVRLAGVLGNENVTRAPQIPRRLAQRATREQEFVP